MRYFSLIPFVVIIIQGVIAFFLLAFSISFGIRWGLKAHDEYLDSKKNGDMHQ